MGNKQVSELNKLKLQLDESSKQNLRLKEFVADLELAMKKLERERIETENRLNKPIRDMEEKMKFVNNLNLRINYTNKTLLIGNKGTGKSTYLWLLKVEEKPNPSFKDGTTKLVFHKDYIDTIGIVWSHESLIKLLVLLIYTEFPRDLIIFTNDRIMQPMSVLASVEIITPIIVILHSSFWTMYNKGKIQLDKNNNTLDKDDLHLIYNTNSYEQIKAMQLGQTITHEDDIKRILNGRVTNNVEPFTNIKQILGDKFKIDNSSSSLVSCIFRYIYIYEKYYKTNVDGMQLFLNSAELVEF